MTASTITETPVATRAFSSQIPKWQRFQSTLTIASTQVAGKKGEQQEQFPYQRQYSHVYHQRLAMLGPRCWDALHEQDVTRVKRVLELQEGVASLVVGAIVKETTSDGDDLHPDSKCKSSDALYLEDESGRVSLEFSESSGMSIHEFPTGIVMGVRGTLGVGGVLIVDAVSAPKLPMSTSPVAMETDDSSDSKNAPHVLLLSGLYCGGAEVLSLPRDMLLAFLQGQFGVEKASLVSRVIVAGGLIQPEDKSQATPALRDLDGFLLQMTASGIPVTVLPGEKDPTTANWPQRPIHSALLPRSVFRMGQLVSRTPNPFAAKMEEKLVQGTDGANVRDLTARLLQSTDVENGALKPISELQALRRTLEWSHICPTGPDSVPTVPHAQKDPMVIEEWPSLYFAGGSKKFSTDTIQHEDGTNCRLVCIPEFSVTGEAVLVNLQTLDVEILRFED